MSVVLVHGGWHGAWAWSRVAAELQRGEKSIAVELPFTGFAEDVSAARDAIDRAGAAAVVSGHSYGGLVVSAAARDLPVKHLVYVSAFMVDEDEDFTALWFSRPMPVHHALVAVNGRVAVDSSKARDVFYGDADATTAETFVPRLRGMPPYGQGAHVDTTSPAWKTLPSTYIICSRDKVIHPRVQHTMARHANTIAEWEF